MSLKSDEGLSFFTWIVIGLAILYLLIMLYDKTID